MTCQNCRRERERREEAEARLAGLLSDLRREGEGEEIARMRVRFGITPACARVLSYMLARPGQLCTHDRLVHVASKCPEMLEDAPAVAKVQIYHLRRALLVKGVGNAIRTAWKDGYILDNNAAQAVKRLLSPSERLAA
jgi:DNA-binding response OmpR family regulator